MNIIEEAKRIWNWLFAKRSELAQLGYKDAFMAHIVIEIMQKNRGHEFKYCPLYSLDPIHPVDNRENALKATKQRADDIRPHKSKLLKMGRLSKEVLAEYLPSATYARVVPMSEDRFVTFEGNGRVAALKMVFAPEDNIEIEVDVYYPKRPRRIRRKIKKLRAMHGMK